MKIGGLLLAICILAIIVTIFLTEPKEVQPTEEWHAFYYQDETYDLYKMSPILDSEKACREWGKNFGTSTGAQLECGKDCAYNPALEDISCGVSIYEGSALPI